MKSPFPGMDPYIEGHGNLWGDFQLHLTSLIKIAIARSLPESFVIRGHYRIPDEAEWREAYLEIYEIEPERRLVTRVEVLSPSSNRPGTPGWDEYQRKRQALLLDEASLVEIDLLRGGTRMPMFDPWPKSPYTLLVARREQVPSCQVWPAHSRLPLPAISVPLTAPHADVMLELQPLVEAVYTCSRYHLSIDYTRPLSPPLSDEDAAWLTQRLRERGA